MTGRDAIACVRGSTPAQRSRWLQACQPGDATFGLVCRWPDDDPKGWLNLLADLRERWHREKAALTLHSTLAHPGSWFHCEADVCLAQLAIVRNHQSSDDEGDP
jgi:hypothetical protein